MLRFLITASWIGPPVLSKKTSTPLGARFLHGRGKVIRFLNLFRIEPDLPNQIAKLPPTPSTRRQQIALQVTLIGPLHHIKGYAAPETKAAVERALLLIKQAEAAGEAPDDPVLPFVVLFGIWASKALSFQGDICLDLATQFLSLARKEGGKRFQLLLG